MPWKNFPEKRIGTIKKLGLIEKKESENDVVWITLQSNQFKWKNKIISKAQGDGKDLMSIFYDNPNHREKFSKIDTVQDEVITMTYVPIVFMLPAFLSPIFCDEETLHGSCIDL